MTSPLEDAEAELRRAQEALEAAQQQLAEANATAKARADAVIAQVREMRPAEPGPEFDAFLKCVGRLYWNTSLSAPDLRKAAGYRDHQEFLRAIGSVTSGVPCSVCQKDIPRTSRSSNRHETSTWAGSPICVDCYNLADAERTRRSDIQELRKHFVETCPVSAPARDWRVATALVLAYPPVSTGIKASSQFDRQTGAWRQFRTATKLQERIAGVAAGETVRVPHWLAREVISSALEAAGWDTARTRSIVDEVTEEAALAVLSRLDAAVKRIGEERAAKACQVYPDDYAPVSEETGRIWEERRARDENEFV